MKISYNEYREPSYELTREETQELEETGYVYDEEMKLCVTMDSDKNIMVWEFTDEYEHLKLTY